MKDSLTIILIVLSLFLSWVYATDRIIYYKDQYRLGLEHGYKAQGHLIKGLYISSFNECKGPALQINPDGSKTIGVGWNVEGRR